MSFENLKRNRDQISKLVSAAEQVNGGGEKKSYGDDRIWKPTVDKAGNGYAVLRFLPAPEGEDLPWVRYWDHGFKGPTGMWYIENSLTSIGQTDPVGELNSRLWNSGIEADKDRARDQKRRLHYVVNVLVVSDPGNPDNEGKVFLYKFGKKIFDKLNEAMNPEFEDESPMNPFDFWAGADFKLKIRNVEGYRNYDKSEFDSPRPLSEDDDELEKIWKSQYSLQELVDPKNFKSYDELKAKMNRVLGLDGGSAGGTMSTADEVEFTEAPKPEAAAAPAFASAATDDDDDDSMSFFEKLAADD